MKRGEFVVEAESPWGVAQGISLALRNIERDVMAGKETLSKHGVTVQWRVVDFVKPTNLSDGSLVAPEAASVAPNLPDISKMDIEEARGIVGTANPEELDVLEMVEKSSAKAAGGRRGVLGYIERRKAELVAAIEKKTSEEADRAAGKPEKPAPKLTQGGAVVGENVTK